MGTMNLPFNTAFGDPEGDLDCKTFLSEEASYSTRISFSNPAAIISISVRGRLLDGSKIERRWFVW
jgi:hypothetical protein